MNTKVLSQLFTVMAIFIASVAWVQKGNSIAKRDSLICIIHDNETGEPIPYVNIYDPLHGNLHGVTNKLGNAALSKDRLKGCDSLAFYAMNYQTMVIAIQDLLNSDTLQLKLKKVSIALDAISIEAKKLEAHDILEQAIQNIAVNYDLESYKFALYYERSISTDSAGKDLNLRLLADGINRNGYGKRAKSHSKSTSCFEITHVDYTDNTFWDENWNYGILYGYGFPITDLVNYDNNILNKKNFNKYKISFVNDLSRKDKYVILAKPEKSTYNISAIQDAKNYQVKLIIDTTTHAIEESFITYSLPPGTRFNNHRTTLENPEFIIWSNYKQIGEKYYLVSSRISLTLYSKNFEKEKFRIDQDYWLKSFSRYLDSIECNNNSPRDFRTDTFFWEKFNAKEWYTTQPEDSN